MSEQHKVVIDGKKIISDDPVMEKRMLDIYAAMKKSSTEGPLSGTKEILSLYGVMLLIAHECKIETEDLLRLLQIQTTLIEERQKDLAGKTDEVN